jgi:hypothetical protein
MTIYLEIAVYLIFLAVLTKILRPKPYSFVFLFVVYTFISYFLAYFLFQYYPHLSTLIRLPVPRKAYFNTEYYSDTFFIFLAGVVSFSVPFVALKYLKPKKTYYFPLEISFSVALTVFLVFNFLSLYLRSRYHAGVPTGNQPTSKIVEYSWYVFHYISLIALTLTAYKGLNSHSLKKVSVSLMAMLIFGVSLLFLGWKSGFIWTILILFHLLFYIRLNNQGLRRQTTKRILFLLIIAAFSLPTVFILTNHYRKNISETGKQFDLEFLKSSALDAGGASFGSDNLVYIFNRVTGISALFPIVAYEDPEKENGVTVWKNLFTRGSYHPETYFGCNIRKKRSACPPASVTYAPTGWGTFYIYNGLTGVIIGFFVLGGILALFESLVVPVIKSHENYIALYSIVYAVIFPSMVFEGTIVFFAKRHFLSFILAFLLMIGVSVGGRMIQRPKKWTFLKSLEL